MKLRNITCNYIDIWVEWAVGKAVDLSAWGSLFDSRHVRKQKFVIKKNIDEKPNFKIPQIKK